MIYILKIALKLAAAILTFVVLGYFFPISKKKKVSGKTYHELEKQYRKYDFAVIPVMFVSIPLYSYLLGKTLNLLNDALTFKSEGCAFALNPDVLAWSVCALPVALIGFAKTIRWFFESILKVNYDEYMEYSDAKSGFDSEGASNLFRNIALSMTLVMLLFLSNWYLHVMEDKIVYKELTTFSAKEYPFTAIDSLITGGGKYNFGGKPTYRIEFLDGNKWDAQHSLCSGEDLDELFKFLSKKSGVKVVYFEFTR